MRQFFVILFVFFLCYNLVEAQTPTFADLPGPEHVLVVYNGNSTLSDSVMQYYKDSRQIPSSNIVPLESLINDDIYDPVSNSTHRIEITQEGEIIRDSTILSYNPIYRHSWLYFVERIAAPIAEHLRTTFVNGTPLKDIIRFIVLCKGVPFRILTTPDHGGSCNQNVPVDGLLCFLGEDYTVPHV